MNKQPNILKLSNIPKVSHIPADMVTEEYTEIPDNFTTLSEWPKRCNYLCYTCTNPIACVPLFLPIAATSDRISRRDKLLFCSPSCLFAHIMTLPQSERDRNTRLARELVLRVSGIPVLKQSCEITESRAVLLEYGGTCDRRTYRESIYLKNKEYFDALSP